MLGAARAIGGATASVAAKGACKAAGVVTQTTTKAYELATTEEQRAQHGARLDEAKDEGVRRAKGAARKVAVPATERVLASAGGKLKLLLTDDAHMPLIVSRTIEQLVDGIWPDVQRHVLIELEKALAPSAPAPIAPPDGVRPWCSLPGRVRAAILHAYKPHDASFWGQLRRPLSVVCLALSMCPWFGVRAVFFVTILALIVAGGTPYDEHQLIAFILHFKATQSLAGVLFLAQGHMMYYACVQLLTEPPLQTCAEDGPGSNRLFVLDMAGLLAYVSLAWLAWLLLGQAQPFGAQRGEPAGAVVDTRRVERRGTRRAPMTADERARARERRWAHGRRVRSLLRYDTLAFLLFALLCVLLEILTEDWDELERTGGSFFNSWRFKATFFLCRALYSLSSFPFLPLALPVVREILTQSNQPTGFDRDGVVQALVVPSRSRSSHPEPPPPAQRAAQVLSGAPSAGGTAAASCRSAAPDAAPVMTSATAPAELSAVTSDTGAPGPARGVGCSVTGTAHHAGVPTMSSYRT